MVKRGTSRRQALQQAQQDVDGLHEVCGVRPGLVAVAEALHQAAQHRQQARLALVVVQQPAGACVSSFHTASG